MNFGEAFKNLREGGKIRRSAMDRDSYLILRKDSGEELNLIFGYLACSHCDFSIEEIISTDWIIDGEEGKTFDEAIESVLKGSTARIKYWYEKYIVYDKEAREIILRHFVEMPRGFIQNDFIAQDWELVE